MAVTPFDPPYPKILCCTALKLHRIYVLERILALRGSGAVVERSFTLREYALWTIFAPVTLTFTR